MRTTHYRASLIGLCIILCLWFGIVAILAGDGISNSLGRIFPAHYLQKEQLFDSNLTILVEDSMSDRRCLNSLQQGNYANAIASCSKAIEDNADNLEARLNLGLANYHLGNYQQAIAQYQDIINKNPHDYRAFYNWGLSEVARGKYQQGIERYNAALNSTEAIAKQDKALIFNDLGATQILRRQYEAAIANLDRAIELDADSKTIYFNRGCAYHHQGNYTAGIDDFTRVIMLDDRYTQAYISRAILYHLIRQEKAAYQDIDTALQQYETKGDRESYQKILGLKDSITASKVQQTA